MGEGKVTFALAEPVLKEVSSVPAGQSRGEWGRARAQTGSFLEGWVAGDSAPPRRPPKEELGLLGKSF